MATGAQVNVEGVARFRATWADAVRDIEDFSKPNRDTAQLISQRARVRAPRRTGALAASIGYDVDEADASIGSDLIYAPVIHYGWPRHHIRARRFLTEAAEQAQGSIPGLYLRHLNTALRQVHGI